MAGDKRTLELDPTGTPVINMAFPVQKVGSTEDTYSTLYSLSVVSGAELQGSPTATNKWLTSNAFTLARATTSEVGTTKLASDAEAEALTADDVVLTPSNLPSVADAFFASTDTVGAGDIDASSTAAVTITDWVIGEIGNMIFHTATLTLIPEQTSGIITLVVLNHNYPMTSSAVTGYYYSVYDANILLSGRAWSSGGTLYISLISETDFVLDDSGVYIFSFWGFKA